MIRHDLVFTDVTEASKLRRIIWVTDLHLDAAGVSAHQAFFNLVLSCKPDFVLIGGDISNGKQSLSILHQLRKIVGVPIYYVLGNHDYYYGSIREIRMLAEKDSDGEVTYLTTQNIIPLRSDTALIGHDGWADAIAGDFLKSDVMLNDYFLIRELKDIAHKERQARLQALGKEAAENIKPRLEEALKQFNHIILLTHPPPFREACQYDGKMSDDNWAPHFVCMQLGDAIKSVMEKNPDKQLLILAGHSHQASDTYILPNVHVLVGDSTLGEPTIQGIIHVG